MLERTLASGQPGAGGVHATGPAAREVGSEATG